MPNSQELYQLEKSVWTEFDFDVMGWHDVYIHSIAWNSDGGANPLTLLFDIDYMFKWIKPEPPSPYYKFWIAPCTLVFFNVFKTSVNLTDLINPIIMGIERHPAPSPGSLDRWEYNIELVTDEPITFQASGFTQFTRKKPICHTKQRLTLEQRDGISFARPDLLPGE